jgi:hypothetical protein
MAYKKYIVVPAGEGYYALDLEFKGDDLYQSEVPPEIHKEPVIAWLVEIHEDKEGEPYTSLVPICVDRLSSFYDGAILEPDGTVTIREKEDWKSLEDYTKDVLNGFRNNQTSFDNKREELHNAKFSS